MKHPFSLWFYRLGIATCFLGFGLWELIAPSLWKDYLPAFTRGAYEIPLVQFHGALLTIVALGVLSGYWRKLFTGLAMLMLLEVCVAIGFDEGFSDTLIRDVGLLLLACGLFVDAVQEKGK